MREMGRDAAGEMRLWRSRLAGPARSRVHDTLLTQPMVRAGGTGRQDAAEDTLKGERIERSHHDDGAQGRPTR